MTAPKLNSPRRSSLHRDTLRGHVTRDPALDSSPRRPRRSPGSSVVAAPRVLHVTEALGGGITTALLEYVKSTPRFDHHLVYTERGAFGTGAVLSERFQTVQSAGSGPFQLAIGLARAMEAHRPDVVHLHSAWAGVIGRLMPGRAPVVYSPHSFYFERTTLRPWASGLAQQVEKVLGRRTAVAACITPHEQRLAKELGMRAAYVPNVVRVPKKVVRAPLTPTASPMPRVVGIGRLSPQKDPAFFADVAAHLSHTELVWVGDGDPLMKTRLEQAGVKVTGWLPRQKVFEVLASADVYLHTAAWEGSPMSLLEAEYMGIRTVVRSIPALESLGHPAGLHAPELVAERVRALLQGVALSSTAPRRTLPELIDAQAESLNAIYGSLIPPARLCGEHP
jgi:glycosyltransferase involved in cell wall biosynthesis